MTCTIRERCSPTRDKVNDISQLLQILIKYSIVQLDGSIVLMHPQIRTVVQNSFNCQALATIIVGNFNKNNTSREELPHILSIWELASDATFKKQQRHPLKIWQALKSLQMVSEEFSFAERSLNRIQNLNMTDTNSVQMEFIVANVLARMGEYEKSLALTQQVYPKIIRVLGEGHRETLKADRQVGTLLVELKQNDEGINRIRSVLRRQTHRYGKNDVDTMETRYILGSIFEGSKHYAEARLEYDKVLKWQISSVGNAHPDTLETRLSLAFISYYQHKFEDAEAQVEEIIQLSKGITKEEDFTIHTRMLLFMALMIFAYRKEEGVLVLRILLERFENILGPNHPETCELHSMILFQSQR
ncbi:uncharacterized protein LOC118435753 [Folsomia candida]|nr:uncharacterized protein LOC118435753 [Folsomia candida]